jgi:UDP-glucose 4-epimerase
MPIDELHPVSGFNPYACSKIICERLCTSYYKHFGVKVVILRPFNIYGPHQRDIFLIPSIITQAGKGQITLKDSSPRRDFVYITDAIDAYLKAAHYGENDFDLFNIGSGTSLSVKEIVCKIASQLKHHVDINFTEEKRKNEIPDTIADISKAQALLKWEPKISFVEGIKAILKHDGLIN